MDDSHIIARPRSIGTKLYILEKHDMKAEIHPAYEAIKVSCQCGNSFETRSTMGRDLHVEICSACHPFYTGQQKIIDTAGRVGKFQKKYGRKD